MMMLHQHATVTICHSKTQDLPGVCRQADILVGAIGRPAFLTAEFIREGAVVVDVGINRLSDRARWPASSATTPGKLAQLIRREVPGRRFRSHRRRRASVGLYAGAGRRGTAHHRHAHVEHGNARGTEIVRMLRVGLTGWSGHRKDLRGPGTGGPRLPSAAGRRTRPPGPVAGRRSLPKAWCREFGSDILDEDGSINRRRLGVLVFDRPDRLLALNQLVHPFVVAKEEEWFDRLEALDAHAIGVVEAAILIETGSYKRFQKLVLTVCRRGGADCPRDQTGRAFPRRSGWPASGARCRFRRSGSSLISLLTPQGPKKKRQGKRGRFWMNYGDF